MPKPPMLPITNLDSQSMRESFRLAMREIEAVLAKKKKITDLTKLAANTVSNYAKIRSTEVHDKALEVVLMRRSLPLPSRNAKVEARTTVQ